MVECVVLLCCGGCDYALGGSPGVWSDALSADVLVRWLFLAGSRRAILILLCDSRPVLEELFKTSNGLSSLSGHWRETFDAARGSPGLVAFGTRSVVKLDGLDWLDGLVRRGVDGRDGGGCCWYVV
jgi:hypothetical protein